MQNEFNPQTEAMFEAQGPRWLTELRPLDLCAVLGALLFVAYRYFNG